MTDPNDITKHGQAIDRAFLFSLLQQPHTVLLESSRQDELNNKNLLFYSPLEILTARTSDEIPALFRSVEEHLKKHHWIAGYVSYEAGYHFEGMDIPGPASSALPLIWFGVYDSPINIPAEILSDIPATDREQILYPRLCIAQNEYEQKIERLKEYIVNGDTYQVNFTDRFEFDHVGDNRSLYFELRKKQHVPFGAFLNLGETNVLSFSPELFFRRSGNSIITKPMKGTCKRGRTNAEDEQLLKWLQNDEKNRSENLMIVDLLRNDIGRICESGTVEVRDMYAVERYETVLQMTSTVQGKLRNDVPYYDLFSALFPCGSVTGAPKIRTMQIINELERQNRGVYCGAIGFISPADESVFNVAIRTLELNGNKGTMGVGSGIVFDSVPKNEYEECKLKAAFLLNKHHDFQLIETMLWSSGFTFRKEHMERMSDSASYWNIPFNREKTEELIDLTERAFNRGKEYRVRLLLPMNGKPTIEAAELTNALQTFTVKIASERINSSDPFFYHKTTNRPLYNRYRQQAEKEAIADYIFLNERNEVTEGTISNLFIEKNGTLITPPLSCGLLSGIYRNEILRTNPIASEKIITVEDLRSADAVFLCNSVRGWRKVTLSE
ncbi:MAG: aminodeoxychorismate synthase component I [Bacteroidota bacterium]